MKKTDHIVVDVNTQELHCKHCGETRPLKLPMMVTEVGKAIDEFKKAHRECEKQQERQT